MTDRLGQLDSALDDLDRTDAALADELFAVVDALASSPTLRRLLTDQATPESDRVRLAQNLLSGRSSAATVDLVTSAVRLRWSGGLALADAVERQAVRAELMAADSLDEVEDALFRLGRVVEGNPELRSTLADRSRSQSDRATLVERLLAGRTSPSTTTLARRAVAARARTFTATLESYVDLAAQLRNRTVATVRVARPLEAEQLERLRAALTAQIGRDLSIQQIIDPEVLGGVRVEFGDEIIEGTVASRLTEARRRFSGS